MARRVNDVTLSETDHAYALDVAYKSDEEKIEFIFQMMSELKWVMSRSYRELAKLWHTSVRNIRKMEDVAHERYLDNISDPEVVKQKIAAQVAYISQSAMTRQKPFVTKDGEVVYGDDPDHKSALQGMKQLADLVVPNVKKHEHTHTTQYEKMTANQLAELAMKAIKDGTIETEGQDNDNQDGLRNLPEPSGVNPECPSPPELQVGSELPREQGSEHHSSAWDGDDHVDGWDSGDGDGF